MKKPTIILSHVAIFALGVAVAFVTAKKQEDGNASDSRNGAASGGNSLASGNGAFGSDDGHRTRRETRESISGNKTKGTPREALGKINNLPDAYERQRALMDFFDKLSPDQFAEVADEFQKIPHYGNTGTEMELLFQAWAKADPLAALDYIDANPETRRNRGEVLETWASSDPAAAEKWALAKHEGDGPNPYMASVVRGIAATDMAHAYRLTESMPVSRERGQAVDAMAKALLMQGTDVAFAYPDTIDDEQLKGGFVMLIAQNLSRVDPQKAADWVASMDDGNIQNRAAGAIADRLARVDTAKASDFVLSLKPESKANAAASIIPAMSQSDIAGTAKWVSNLAGTPGYDKVVESFVWSCDERAPEQSAAWIRGIADQNQQIRLYHRMLGNWAKRDANAVRTWIGENDVPETIRKRFSR